MDPDFAEASVLAQIDEAACIGCTLCIAACPVDAIVGAAKLMHTVIAERCTGCELCLPPCPVECIVLVPRDRPWTVADAARAQTHFRARAARLARLPSGPEAQAVSPTIDQEALRARRRAAVAAALVRARARRARLSPVARRT
jgi:Na+-translocating ferredoxin:NAD+ oxidoreductase subunit B